MRDTTKNFYQGVPWPEILEHPDYQQLASREIEALIRFLPTISFADDIEGLVHLGVGSFREVPYLVHAFPGLECYVVNDICRSTVELVVAEAQSKFEAPYFKGLAGDIELPLRIDRLRNTAGWPVMIALTGNGVIFANRTIDIEIARALFPSDYFLLTLEIPHESMTDCYRIEPCYRLLSQSGILATENNTNVWYDESDQCLKMECEGNVLLASYKPTAEQLRERMKQARLKEVSLVEYPDIHMIGSLWQK